LVGGEVGERECEKEAVLTKRLEVVHRALGEILVGIDEESPAPEHRATFWQWEHSLVAPLGGRRPEDRHRVPPVSTQRFIGRIEAESRDEAC